MLYENQKQSPRPPFLLKNQLTKWGLLPKNGVIFWKWKRNFEKIEGAERATTHARTYRDGLLGESFVFQASLTKGPKNVGRTCRSFWVSAYFTINITLFNKQLWSSPLQEDVKGEKGIKIYDVDFWYSLNRSKSTYKINLLNKSSIPSKKTNKTIILWCNHHPITPLVFIVDVKLRRSWCGIWSCTVTSFKLQTASFFQITTVQISL